MAFPPEFYYVPIKNLARGARWVLLLQQRPPFQVALLAIRANSGYSILDWPSRRMKENARLQAGLLAANRQFDQRSLLFELLAGELALLR